MLIWRGLKPAAIVTAMLVVQAEWKRGGPREGSALTEAGRTGSSLVRREDGSPRRPAPKAGG